MDPDRRLTAAQALKHPYFKDCRDASKEFVTEPFQDELINAEDFTAEQWKGKQSSFGVW